MALNLKYHVDIIPEAPRLVQNLGDALNPFLFSYFTQKEMIKYVCFYEEAKNLKHAVLGMGSILDSLSSGDIVFGTGFISQFSKAPRNLECQINAVRGPLTRDTLIKLGYNCPEVFGDPGLLLPFIIPSPGAKPTWKTKTYKLGIIPHYVDQNNVVVEQLKKHENVLVIDILCGDNPKKFVREINSCEFIISSSLHGIIFGDAYNIPSYHFEPSEKVHGEGFKFRDYFLSVNREYEKIQVSLSVPDIISQLKPYRCKLNLEKLINNFPSIDYNIHKMCIEKLSDGFMSHLHSNG